MGISYQSIKESNPKVASLTSQLEIMKAQMKLMEAKGEQAQLKIEILQRQCRKKDRDLEWYKDECANTYESHTKRKKNEKEVENALSELKKMQDKIAAMEGEIVMIQEENEHWRANSQLCEQEMEALQQNLLTTRAEAVEWKDLASNHLDSLSKANQMEKVLWKKIDELAHERNWQKSEVQRLEREKMDLLNEPLILDGYYEGKMKEWMKRYGEMTNCVKNHTAELSDRLQGVMEDINMSQLPMTNEILSEFN